LAHALHQVQVGVTPGRLLADEHARRCPPR
jgi:hypothetical protein